MSWQRVGKLDENGLPNYVCLEADTKPTTGIVTGARVIQLDGTNKGVHVFDGTAWYHVE